MSKEALRVRYRTASSRREYDGVRSSKEVSEMLAFMDSTIKKQFQSFTLLSFSLCGGDRRFKVDPAFEAAFLALSLEQQITHFELALSAYADPTYSPPTDQTEFESLTVQVTKGLKAGRYSIRLVPYVLDCTNYEIQLDGYLLRRSKKNKEEYILQCLRKQDPPSIRFHLPDPKPSKDTALISRSKRSFTDFVKRFCQQEEGVSRVKLSGRPEGPRVRMAEEGSTSPIKQSSLSIDIQCRSQLSGGELAAEDRSPREDRSVVAEVLLGEQDTDEELYELVERKNQEYAKKDDRKKYRKNVAQVLLPELSLVDIDNLNDYLPIWQDEAHRLYIYQHASKPSQLVMELHVKERAEAVVRQLCEVQSYKLWNPAINQSHVKLSISSDNTYLVYLKQRALSEWFRQRDFLFLRHLCRVGTAYYLIDCSIENPHFMPFQTILRATIKHAVTRIEPAPQENTRILMQMDVQYGGLVTGEGKTQLAVRLLQGFMGLQSFISRFKGEYKCPYDLDWEICLSSEQAQPSRDSETEQMPSNMFDQHLQPVSSHRNDQQDEFYSIQDEQERPVLVEVSEEEQARAKRKAAEISYLEEKIQRDEQGLVVLPKAYLNVRHQLSPVSLQPRRKRLPYANLMVKNDFRIAKTGGLILINEPKIAAQDNVIKFMMSTLKKNLFSGKGILNISLPVEIFNTDSNLQRLCESLALAPRLLQRAAAEAAVQRFKLCVAFAFSNSVLYFDMEKPFNPILGETFQGFIAGCPVYAEQVSHHPPISAILMLGRGYRIHGCLQAKVYVHLNSGEGVNEGLYTLEFEDGGRVVFQTCPGEISGLAVGQRKFRFKGKTYIVDAKNRLFCSINFEEETGMFSRSKWQFSDQMQGEIVRVSESFIRNFFQGSGKDLPCPAKKDIEEHLGKVGGRWVEGLTIDGKECLNVEETPFEMSHYEYPLNSNSNYREDLLYRKLNDLARSQSEKERLEVLQRNDRKLREKYHPSSH